MIGGLFGLFFIGWCFIYPLTDFYIRFINRTTIRKKAAARTRDQKRLYLTFDDGPDPVYTPQILKILAESKVPAIFFLIGAKAEQYPQVVANIVQAGHEIGLHTYHHRHAYLMFAKKSRESIAQSKAVLERLTGRRVRWFRPPWGALNFFQFRMVLHYQLPVVLWSANARDWKVQTGRMGILRRMQKKLDNGAVMVLHDSGGETGAPQNTVAVLAELITACRAKGYQFGRLNDKEVS